MLHEHDNIKYKKWTTQNLQNHSHSIYYFIELCNYLVAFSKAQIVSSCIKLPSLFQFHIIQCRLIYYTS